MLLGIASIGQTNDISSSVFPIKQNLLFNKFNYNRVDEFFYNGCMEKVKSLINNEKLEEKQKKWIKRYNKINN